MSTNIITDFQINNNLTITDNNLKIQTDGDTNTLDISGNVDISNNLIIRGYVGVKTETPVVSIDIRANDALRLPVGNNSSRPDYTTIDCSGCIRYNSETTQFEGFSPTGFSWIGLGGVVDIDQDTKILAELNADEDKLRFYTAGGQQMLIDEYGNVGIGLASDDDPAYILDINSTGAMRIPIGTTLQRDDITNTAGLIRYNSTNNEFEGYSTAWGGLGGVKTPTGNTKITADDTNGLEFFTSDDEKMTILANGNVGIGVTDPDEKLEVAGNIKIGGNIESNNYPFTNQLGYFSLNTRGAKGGNSTAIGYDTTASGEYSTAMGRETNASAPNSTAIGYYTTASGAQSTAMGSSTIASAGNSTAMGYSTKASAPNSTAIGIWSHAGSSHSTAIGNRAYTGGNIGFAVGCHSTEPVAIADSGTANNNKLVILNDGNVGIGTTTPGSSLHVKTTTNFQGIFLDDESGLIVKIARGDTTRDPYIKLYGATGKGVDIQSNSTSYFNGGNVGIGTDSPAEKLHVSGNTVVTGDITAYYSDERLKTFKGKIKEPLAKIKQLNGYYFVENELAKSLGYDNDKLQVGVSAQEVEKVLPEIVTKAPIDNKYKTVWYQKLTPLLIEGMKEQQGQIEKQQGQIETQQGQIETQQGQIETQQGQIETLQKQIDELKALIN